MKDAPLATHSLTKAVTVPVRAISPFFNAARSVIMCTMTSSIGQMWVALVIGLIKDTDRHRVAILVPDNREGVQGANLILPSILGSRTSRFSRSAEGIGDGNFPNPIQMSGAVGNCIRVPYPCAIMPISDRQ